jgi:hypothetical protein
MVCQNDVVISSATRGAVLPTTEPNNLFVRSTHYLQRWLTHPCEHKV